MLGRIDDENCTQTECFRLTLEKWIQQDTDAKWGTLELAITNANRIDMCCEPLLSLDDNEPLGTLDDGKIV